MFRPDHLVNLTIALPLDDPFGTYIYTAAKCCSARSRLRPSLPLSIALALPFVAAEAKLFTAIWGTALFKMWPFDAVTGVGKRTDASSSSWAHFSKRWEQALVGRVTVVEPHGNCP